MVTKKTNNGQGYRLGLDIGTNSIGWAAIRLDDGGNPCGILNMGVRIFPDGRNPRDGSSNAVKRRIPRGQRRRRDRYLKRRSHLLRKLVEYGLMPDEKCGRKALAGLDPYKLRVKALDNPLQPFELGRALFHLNQRRGFRSNRKAGGEDENEAKKTRAEIDTLRGRIENSGARSLGEYLARRRKKSELVRARPESGLYPDRGMYESEFDKIRNAQEPHHALTPDQWDSLKDVILYQRHLKPVDPGWCTLESGEKRAARALPIAQEIRMLQEVNNLKLRVGFEPERPLNNDERARALKRLRSGKDINLERPTRRELGLESDAEFNLARGGRKIIKGDETSARLMVAKKEKGEKKAKEVFGDRWLHLSLEGRNEIVRFLLDTEEPERVRQKAKADWALDDHQARAVSEIGLPDRYSNLSEKAMWKLLPHLQEGLVYSDAVVAAEYRHHSDFRNTEAHERLPYYGKALERDVVGANPNKDPKNDGEVARYGRIGNPTVHIGLNQIRRVANKLIEVYGKPEEIVVELARELKLNRDRLRELEIRNREGGQRNERFREMLESAEGGQITADMLQRLRLWEEQGPPHERLCPYTGKSISFDMATSARTEVDHILPFSRTLDNSMSNKVLCVAGSNRAKGDKSPYEAFGHSPPGFDYQGILARSDKLPDNKKWRFKQDAMERFKDQDEFLDRQLNETQYLSRTARTYLAHLYDETTGDEKTGRKQRVRVIPGRMTALLRRGWGLEGMLRERKDGEAPRKQRDDHRHHAIDAFVVANTTQGLLQKFASASAESFDMTERLASLVPLPWNGFHWNDVKSFLDRMVVSYKPDHGTRGGRSTTGQLHNETAYGLIDALKDGSHKVVIRKKLSDMKRRRELESVGDPVMRTALLELWDRVASEGGKPVDFAEKAGSKGVLLDGRHQVVRRVRVVDKQRVIPIKDKAGNAYKGYLPGGNEYAEVWRVPDGSWQMVVVPTFEANQTGFDINRYRPDPEAKKLMRLQIDDMGALGEGQHLRIVRVRYIDAGNRGRVILDDHNEADVPNRIKRDKRIRKKTGADTGMKEEVFSARKLRRLGFRKIGVDEIGRVRDPGPRK